MAHFQSTSPVFCRWCGKGLQKWTTTVQVHRGERKATQNDSNWWRHIYPTEDLKTKAECQAFTNQIVLSVKYTEEQNAEYEKIPGSRRITQFNEWDGVTYKDELFCGQQCAAAMGYSAARQHGLTTKAYRDAIAGAKAKVTA